MKGKKKKHNGGTSVNSKLLRKPIQRCFLLFLAPTFLAFCIGFIYPFLRGIYLSFCEFVTIGDASFVGFRNYMDAFNDASFIHAFWYTALYAIVSLFLINNFDTSRKRSVSKPVTSSSCGSTFINAKRLRIA